MDLNESSSRKEGAPNANKKSGSSSNTHPEYLILELNGTISLALGLLPSFLNSFLNAFIDSELSGTKANTLLSLLTT